MDDKIIFAKLEREHYAGLVFAFVFAGIGLAFAIFSHNPVFRVAGAFVACGFAYFFGRNAWSGVPREAALRLGQLQFPVKWSDRSPEELRSFVSQFTEFR